MTFTAPVELNFEPANKSDIFGVPVDRAFQLMDQAEDASRAIAKNHEGYLVFGTGQFEGKARLDEAKVLKELLHLTQNINEWLFVVYSATSICNDINDAIKDRLITKAVFDKLKSIGGSDL